MAGIDADRLAEQLREIASAKIDGFRALFQEMAEAVEEEPSDAALPVVMICLVLVVLLTMRAGGLDGDDIGGMATSGSRSAVHLLRLLNALVMSVPALGGLLVLKELLEMVDWVLSRRNSD